MVEMSSNMASQRDQETKTRSAMARDEKRVVSEAMKDFR